MLGSLGHLSLLTVPTSQKKHQGTLDWGLRKGCPGSTLVWSLLPGCLPLPGVPRWGEFQLETAVWRFRAKPSFGRRICCTQDLNSPHHSVQPNDRTPAPTLGLERVTVK